jgi:hypothetical protein
VSQQTARNLSDGRIIKQPGAVLGEGQVESKRNAWMNQVVAFPPVTEELL